MHPLAPIGGIGSAGRYAPESKAPRDIAVDLKQAIKDYRDEQLTGLTDDEKAEIKRLCDEYLKDNPVVSDADRAEYLEYYKSLLIYYGFKGDINAMLAEQAAALDGKDAAASGAQAALSAYTGIRGSSVVMTELDGEMTLMIMAEGGLTAFYKTDTAATGETDMGTTGKVATGTGAAAAKFDISTRTAKNLDDYEKGMMSQSVALLRTI